MVGVFQIKVDSAYVVMVHSVLDVLKIIVGYWHTQLKQFLGNFLLWILELVLQLLISCINSLLEWQLCHFIVHLSKLLHFKVVLAN